MVWIMFRGRNKDIRTTSTSSDSFVDFEQVNDCWDVIKNLLNDFWPIFKMLCSKCCSCLSNFYWHNALMYLFLNKRWRVYVLLYVGKIELVVNSMRLEFASEFASISDTLRSAKFRRPAKELIFSKGNF